MKVDHIPRCPRLDGSTLQIIPTRRVFSIHTEAARGCGADRLTVTDGTRAAIYVPTKGAATLTGATRRIVPNFTEPGRHREANCISVTDGQRRAFYVPSEIAPV